MNMEEAINAADILASVAYNFMAPNEQRKAVGLNPILKEIAESPEPLICKFCGGQIDRKTMKCIYCDTEYCKE